MAIPNLTNYTNKKSAGLIFLQKIDSDNFAILNKKFSEDDGSALPSEVVGVTIIEIDAAIAQHQQEIDKLNVFKTDLKNTV